MNENTTLEVSPGVVCEDGTITNLECGYNAEASVKVNNEDGSSIKASVGHEKVGERETTYGEIKYEKKVSERATINGGVRLSNGFDDLMAFFGFRFIF
jgi:hypothetical protein